MLPLDASVATRLVAPRPEYHRGPERVHLHAADDRHRPRRRAELLNTSYTITADIEVPQGGGEGMIVTAGRPLRRLRLLPAEG